MSNYATDCLTCGSVAIIDVHNGAAHRRWARQHTRLHPGHRVHVERTVVTVYGDAS